MVLMVGITTNWKILHEMGIPDLLTCLLRNLYAGQEATVRTVHGTTDWFQIEKEVRQGCILPPCLFNLCAEYIMRNAGLDEAQSGIKIARRNINNLRYADNTTLMAENKEELKSLLERYNLTRQNQEDIENINGPIISTEIQTVIKNLPTRFSTTERLYFNFCFTGKF